MRRTARAAAAVGLSGALLFGAAAPALAQAADPCYPDCPTGVSDSTAVPGQVIEFNSGSGTFPAGTEVAVEVLGQTFTVTADQTGSANLLFRVPEETEPGRYEAVFVGAGNVVRIPFTVVAGAAAAPGRGQLPRTGSEDLGALTVAGVSLVVAGAGIVVAVRRRRTEMPPSVA